jgi:predicted dehydrogenase
MPRQWRCAVVGTGVVGEWHVRTIPTVPNARLVAVCDRDPNKAAAALAKNRFEHVPRYTDLGEMLAKEEIDVVHVCTPSGAHMEPCVTAVEAGKHVICEKPLEIQLDRIDRMNEVARQNNVHLAAVFQNRWHDANRAIKQAADEGRFGRITWAGSFTCWFRDERYYEAGGWRGTWAIDGGGAVMNQSVHSIDLLQWIVGPVKTVSAYAASRIHPKIEVEDTLTCSLQFENGAFGTIVGTTAMYPGQAARLEVGGEHGTAISQNGLKAFRFREERPGDQALRERLAAAPQECTAARIRGHGGEELYQSLFGAASYRSTGGGASATDVGLDLHGRNIHAILTAWDEGHEAETSGVEARKAVAIILAMYESVRKNGAPVDVK